MLLERDGRNLAEILIADEAHNPEWDELEELRLLKTGTVDCFR
jgi:hypothetical protein